MYLAAKHVIVITILFIQEYNKKLRRMFIAFSVMNTIKMFLQIDLQTNSP